MRSMIIGLLGLATAAGLGVVALAANQGWPEQLTNAIVPHQEHRIGPAEVVSRTPSAEAERRAVSTSAAPGVPGPRAAASPVAAPAPDTEVSQPGGGPEVDASPSP